MNKKNIPKKSRPSIPDHVKLELWAKSGGRCQFKGCNKPLWHDHLTMNALNQSHISHIVSWTPKGPRGDAMRSENLSVDICNLLLLCPQHNKEIDNKRFILKYTEPLLQRWKKEHEKRIEIVTDINNESKTAILIFKSNIGNNFVEVDPRQVTCAIFPYYPIQTHPYTIDLTKLNNKEDNYWKSGFKQIEIQINSFLDKNNFEITFKHISVFALAPIPFLIKLGYSLGDTIPMRLFQKHRDVDNWNWKISAGEFPCFKITECTSKRETVNHIALVFSLSGKVKRNEYQPFLKEDWEIIEIYIDEPNTGFLREEIQLMNFRKMYREVLANIRIKWGTGVKIHIFPAIPAPIAVEIGTLNIAQKRS